ncbi:hypothetical protein HNQ51_001441 [Inhella inkyongensis]|uniref:TMEM205-like domain-containing protein n=1 Tax=Inhella inkyongensis TaxID=392593 RepID=A0A840S3X5_9BURK|nr:DUF4149 domain-containing protein [Inhella inkyongensis]MBB5204148.1 hypothetical protein [Inhella inkyongensis]
MRGLLAALWAGQLLTVALLAAPNAFAVLARPEAAAYVQRLFALDAKISLGLGLLMVLMEQRLQRWAHPERVYFSAGLLLPALTIGLTVLGHEVLVPQMAAARVAGEGFAWLHGLSMAAFAGKTLAVLTLAWRQR